MATDVLALPEPGEVAPGAATMCEAFQATAERYADAVALRTADGADEVTFAQYAARARSLASGLAGAGIGRGDTVALLMSNRPEFHICDTAAMHLGAIPFSIYATSSVEQIAYLLSNSRSRVVIVEEAHVERMLAAIAAAEDGGVERPTIACIDGRPEGTITLEELEAGAADDFDFEAAWRAVDPQDVLTLIYTSGTTGPPKGVELTHANMLAECRALGEILPFRPGARATSYLPTAHIADRWSSHYSQMLYGIQINSVADARMIAVALVNVRPTAWGAVPRVLEKLKSALETAIAADPDADRRAAAEEAIACGLQKVRLEQAGEAVPRGLAERHAALDATVLSKLREKIGLDQAEWLVVGAAPLQLDVQEYLLALGLKLTEVWGMSEASCCATCATIEAARIGTVGPPVAGVELRLADDGELLMRGPTVMRGYRGDPQKTAEAIDSEGWLHTGDIATIDDDGHVRIVDRKKELIINAAGKNMSPANIEATLKSAHRLIGQVCVVGDRRPYNVALVVLDPDAASAYASTSGRAEATTYALARDAAVESEIADAVHAANERLSRVEQIKRFELLGEEWLPGGDELTPTMKLKRKPIEAKYAEQIERLYLP